MSAPARTRRPAPSAPWVEAIAAIVRGAAPLPGAACRGDARFTSDDPDDQAEAIEICQRCPELIACARWRDSLPRSRIPPGVTAGIVNPPRPRKKAPADD